MLRWFFAVALGATSIAAVQGKALAADCTAGSRVTVTGTIKKRTVGTVYQNSRNVDLEVVNPASPCHVDMIDVRPELVSDECMPGRAFEATGKVDLGFLEMILNAESIRCTR